MNRKIDKYTITNYYYAFNCFCAAYFLEDTIQLLNFDPSAESRKRKKNKKTYEDAETAIDDDDNMNKYVSDEYSELTKNRVAALSEKDISFELIEASTPV